MPQPLSVFGCVVKAKFAEVIGLLVSNFPDVQFGPLHTPFWRGTKPMP